MLAQLRHLVASATLFAILVAATPLAASTPSAEATPPPADVVEATTASVVSAAGVTAGNLRAVAFVSGTTGFAAADNGVIMKTTDSGQTWTQVRGADSYAFRGIDFWDATTGVAVDYYGKVASTTNGGVTWTNIDFAPDPDMDGPTSSNPNRTHNDVACSPTSSAVLSAAGDEAPTDGNWYGGTFMGATSTNLRYWGNPLRETKPHRYLIVDQWVDVGKGELLDIEYVGSTIWASGIDYWTLDTNNPVKYPVFKSIDGGVSYTKVSFGTIDARLEGIAFGSATAGITVGQLVGGTRKAYYTTDGGVTWPAAVTLPGTAVLNAVDMSSATQGWAVSSDGGIIRTTDGGNTWTACTITGGNAFPLYDVEFRDGTTNGWAVGASGTVLRTTDGVTWNRPNSAPVAVADAYSTPEDTPRTVAATGVLGNDTDAEGDSLTAIKVSDPSHGSVTLNANGSFTYTPQANYNGVDSFTYKANDGTTDSNIVAVTITITAVNDVPVAADDAYSTLENTAKVVPAPGVLANDTDADGTSLTARNASDPPHGSVTLNNDGSFTYTPDAAYSGTDSFTYQAYDGTDYSAPATVVITIGDVDHAPVAVADAYETAEDTPLVQPASGVLGNDSDADGDPLTAVKVSNPSHGTVTLNSNGSFTYTPQANYNGVDSFTYQAYDTTNYSNIAAVTITVNPANDAPIAAADAYTTAEDTPLSVALPGVLANDSDPDGTTPTAVNASDPPHGTVVLNTNGSFTYTPDLNYSGTDSFTYQAFDGVAYSPTVTVTLTVTPVNDAPVAAADAYSTPANTAKVVSASGVLANDTDAEGSGLTAHLVGSPSHGTLSLAENGGFTYTPVTGYSGIDSFTYRAYDGVAYSGAVTVTITVGTGAPVLTPVYRFYNVTNGTHFYTDSASERDMVIAKWPTIYNYEGPAYSLNPFNNTQRLTRLYNKVSGSHFYTASPSEAASALAKWPTVFSLDGLTYAVSPGEVYNSIPVYRFYNLTNGSHFYTASADERNMVIAKWPKIYSYEGPAFWLGQ